jgi:hypothetical protein
MLLQELHASEVVQRKVLRIWIRWAFLLRQICMHRVGLLMLRLSERNRNHQKEEQQQCEHGLARIMVFLPELNKYFCDALAPLSNRIMKCDEA